MFYKLKKEIEVTSHIRIDDKYCNIKASFDTVKVIDEENHRVMLIGKIMLNEDSMIAIMPFTLAEEREENV